ncbi:MAG: hypothetical protein JWN66_3392 [Sphingomonas bacterium]|jgi:hypothetical protein|uniref:hypothetical protein n=1 Tax=Sphingomonas bacterium TaxID=1895847 RepID=UPI0026167816|nr:hypothetical protein [Sphingomonas bacterium]MDB5706276.1 hypothetical protein [Sphingomonas bacterium]
MKFSRVTAAIVMASLSSPLFAGAEQSVGKLTAASEGTFISRDGTLTPATAGQSLYAGDRIVTRGQANAKVAFPGCNFAMAPTSVLSVGASTCATAPKSFAQDGGDAGAGAGENHGGGVILGLAILAAGAGTYFAFAKNNSKPASP